MILAQKRTSFLVFAVLFTLATLSGMAQVLTPVFPNDKTGFNTKRLHNLDRLFNDYVDSQWIGGATVLIAKAGNIVYHKAFGYSNVEQKTPMKTDHIFRIASQTKAITSVAIMMLMEEGKLLLTDPVSKYLPAFDSMKVLQTFNAADSSYTTIPVNDTVTIHHLLTHTSGIGYAQIGSREARAIYAKANIAAGINVEEGRLLGPNMQKLATMPLMHQPGERFTYGLNTDLLGNIVELVSGQPLDQFFRERIFKPLGMTDSWFYLPPSHQNRLVALHTENEQQRVTVAKPGSNGKSYGDFPNSKGTYFSGGAGLSSTALDYAIFMEMLRNKGSYRGKCLLSPAFVTMMTQNQIGDLNVRPSEKFGLGFSIVTKVEEGKPGPSPGTFSWSGAFSSTYFIDPKNQIIAQVFINQSPNSHAEIHEKFKGLVYEALE